MSHDAELAQKHLIKETRGSYEMEKVYRKIDKLMERMDVYQQALNDVARDVKAIKEHLNIR